MGSNIITDEEFKKRLAWPLDRKINETMERIDLWVQYWGKDACVSYSGGLDSTVLLDIVRSHPRINGAAIPAFFADTGTEYPDIRRFVKATPGITWVRPKMKFHEVIKKYGYPVVSKQMAQYIGQVQRAKTPQVVRLRLTGWTARKKYSPMSKISQKWQFLTGAPFQVSDKCCALLKKHPLKKMGVPMIGVRAAEPKNREKTYLMSGCNAFDNKTPRSWPMAFWTDADVKEYIKIRKIEYCSIYDLGYKRTGCFPCAFGLHLEPWPNRYQLMEKTHPRLWNLCMDRYGFQAVFEFMNEWLPKKQQLSYKWRDYEGQKSGPVETQKLLFKDVA